MTLKLAAERPAGYVYADNRAVVICNGLRAVLFNRVQGRWLRESVEVLAEEGRATRHAPTDTRPNAGGIHLDHANSRRWRAFRTTQYPRRAPKSSGHSPPFPVSTRPLTSLRQT